MCGRVIRTSPVEALREIFDLVAVPDGLRDRYNLAPSEPIPVIRRPHHLELLRWGLKMPDARMAGINARVESLTKPIYRDKVRDNRCLIVVDGFYEWRSLGGKKFPYLIARQDKAPLVMAGIYDSTDGCAIITAPSQGLVSTLHDRMPLVLPPDSFAAWLDQNEKDVRSILAQATADGLTCYPVSRAVNSVRNDDPRLIEPVSDPVAELPTGKTLTLF
jgi:putative SOS response-associated peptidase YedK